MTWKPSQTPSSSRCNGGMLVVLNSNWYIKRSYPTGKTIFYDFFNDKTCDIASRVVAQRRFGRMLRQPFPSPRRNFPVSEMKVYHCYPSTQLYVVHFPFHARPKNTVIFQPITLDLFLYAPLCSVLVCA